MNISYKTVMYFGKSKRTYILHGKHPERYDPLGSYMNDVF